MSKAVNNELLERYRKLNELARDLASTLDLNTLLNHIVEAASELCNAQEASILLYDEKARQLRFETITNLDAPLMHGMVVPVENSIAGWIVTNRKPIIISDATQDPRHYDGMTEATDIVTDSLLGVPLIAKGHVVGVLEVINKHYGDFTVEDQDVLMALGAQAAVAIDNARLFQQSDQISELLHELRTPLTSINMAAKLLLDPEFPADSQYELVEMILGETRRLTNMATDFLDLSRLETGRTSYHFQEIELASLIDACVQLVTPGAEEADINISIDIPERLPPLHADYDKLKQVLLNLLSNAIKYNRAGGEVHIQVTHEEHQNVMHIRDTGIGIPPESLPLLFEKFYRVPGNENMTSGAGLGLTICKRIIEDHGGQISVHSQVDAGTTFEIYLPTRNE